MVVAIPILVGLYPFFSDDHRTKGGEAGQFEKVICMGHPVPLVILTLKEWKERKVDAVYQFLLFYSIKITDKDQVDSGFNQFEGNNLQSCVCHL